MGPVVIAIAVLVTLIIAVPVTAVVAISYRKKVVETKIGNADEKARQIVDDALKVADKETGSTARSERGILENQE